MGGGHVSRPDFGMPQPDAAYPLTEFYLLAQQALEKKRQLYAARPLRRAASPCPAHLPGGGCRISAACGCSGRGPDPAALPCPDAAFIQQPAGATGRRPRRPFADRGVHPPDRGGAAAAALCVGGPAAAAAGCSGGAHPAIDHAGRDGHRHRPPPHWRRSWCTAPMANAGCTTPKPRPFSPSGWRCCKGSINKEGAPSPLFTFCDSVVY